MRNYLIELNSNNLIIVNLDLPYVFVSNISKSGKSNISFLLVSAKITLSALIRLYFFRLIKHSWIIFELYGGSINTISKTKFIFLNGFLASALIIRIKVSSIFWGLIYYYVTHWNCQIIYVCLIYLYAGWFRIYYSYY